MNMLVKVALPSPGKGQGFLIPLPRREGLGEGDPGTNRDRVRYKKALLLIEHGTSVGLYALTRLFGQNTIKGYELEQEAPFIPRTTHTGICKHSLPNVGRLPKSL